MKTITKLNVNSVIDDAFAAASAATNRYLANSTNWYPCGFAWVTIRPARGILVAALKARKLGHSGYNGGYEVYNPSQNYTQEMYAKEAGARAFADFLKQYGVNVTVGTRMD